jgi:hypothetical protein
MLFLKSNKQNRISAVGLRHLPTSEKIGQRMQLKTRIRKIRWSCVIHARAAAAAWLHVGLAPFGEGGDSITPGRSDDTGAPSIHICTYVRTCRSCRTVQYQFAIPYYIHTTTFLARCLLGKFEDDRRLLARPIKGWKKLQSDIQPRKGEAILSWFTRRGRKAPAPP